jgi:hypothetical protein
MNKFYAVFQTSLLVLSLSCGGNTSLKKTDDEISPQLNQGEILLSEARIRMRKKLTAPPQEITDPLMGDLKTLARMSQKSNYDTLEIQKFLEIEPKKYKNNVEFSQLYNETLFRIMEREPRKFVKSTINTKENTRVNLNKQINAPVNDGLNTKSVKEKLQKEVQLQWQLREPNIETNDEQQITKEYENFKSVNTVFDGKKEQIREPRKLIEIRRRDSIQRHLNPRSPLLRQPLIERSAIDTVQ